MDNAQSGMKARVDVKRPWLAILPLMLGSFVGMFSETSLNIALPQLMKALQVGQSSIQWLVTGYMLVIGIVLPLSSLLTKWFATKNQFYLASVPLLSVHLFRDSGLIFRWF